jgi:hypothetical protein
LTGGSTTELHDHDSRYYTQTELSTSGSSSVNWGNLTDIPAGLDLDASDDITTSTAAGGDLLGTYPNPTVSAIQGSPVSATAPTSGQALLWSGTEWLPHISSYRRQPNPCRGSYRG